MGTGDMDIESQKQTQSVLKKSKWPSESIGSSETITMIETFNVIFSVI